MPDPLVIGIDCSTTSCKAIVWNDRGEAVATGRSTLAFSSPAPGWGEQDPEWWTHATIAAIKEAVAAVNPLAVAAVCITHQRESFVCLDHGGKPLRPAILWLDDRASREVAELSDRVNRDEYIRISGKIPDLSLSLPKILWLRKHEGDTIKRTAKILETGGYLNWKLTGKQLTSWPSADPMGVLDMEKRCWSTQLTDALALHPGWFCELCPPGEILGPILDGICRETGLPTGVPLVAGGGDGQCAVLGAGVLAPGSAAMNLGTAVVSGVHAQDYHPSSAFRTLCGGMPRTYIPESVIRGGTATLTWFVDRMAPQEKRHHAHGGKLPERLLDEEAARIPAGCDGLITIPYWHGANGPHWLPEARGVVLGWSDRHTRAHFFRSILEGIALEQKLIYAHMEQALGHPIQEVRLLGGGARSALWCQIIRDVFNMTVRTTGTPEATCLGAGILAAGAVGIHGEKNFEAACRAMTRTEQSYEAGPDTGVYAALTKRYQHLSNLVPLLSR